MPYLVLAFGLMMSVIGVVSIVFGYPIIQVERGWASVIAGATLLAGGAVTAALGLLLKAVKDIGLRDRGLRDIAALPISQPIATPVVDFGGLELPVAKKTTAPSVADLPSTSLDPSLAPETPAQEAPSPEVTIQADKAEEAPPLAYDEPIEPTPAPEPLPVNAPETSGPPIHPLPDPALPHPALPGLIPPSPKAEPEPAVLTDDWLEQSFAQFDRENAGLIATAPAEPEPIPAISEPSAVPDPHHAIPVAEPAPAPAPSTLPEHSSAVIGRYEADGTSYVMYADGSIEASSPAGVYRFASMAELKAYIEG